MVGMYTDQYSSRQGTATKVTQSLSLCMLEHNIKATECFHCHVSSNRHFVSPVMSCIVPYSLEEFCFNDKATQEFLKRSCFYSQ